MSDEEQKPRILAVDDSRVMRRAMSKVLSKDYDVVEAENGEDAWTILLNDESIHVVFTDLSMPFLDGYGLLERMRTSDDAHLVEMPVIIITGNDDDDEAKQEALDKGANDFITKPFDSIQLQARAKAHITHKQKTTNLTDKLANQATTDAITGLGGQQYFIKVGEEILSYANRHGGQFILVRMDIDGFNNLFIKHGKQTIDQILQVTGEKFSQHVRQEDTIARIGLSKFALILKETNMDDANILAERIREEIQNLSYKIPDSGDVIKLTISGGLYEPELNPNLLFKDIISKTEKYLAEASSAGGNRLVSHASTNSTAGKKPVEDINILELLEKLKENKPEELLPQIDSILHHITPLLKFLVVNARDKLQEALRQTSKK